MSTQTIAFPVGDGGMNIPEDITTVWQMLTSVPPEKGGVLAAPQTSTNDLAALIAAIKRFQQAQLILPASGLVTRDSPTLFKLSQFSGDAGSDYFSSMRDRVCALARSYC